MVLDRNFDCKSHNTACVPGSWRIAPRDTAGAWRSEGHHESAQELRNEWRPLRSLGHIESAIERSRYLLELRDEDDGLAVDQNTWERATKFLEAAARRSWNSFGVKIEAPLILLGPDRSIDLHWRHPGYEMLINIPADAAVPAAYYGDDKDGNSTKGTVVSGDNLGLLQWLTTKR